VVRQIPGSARSSARDAIENGWPQRPLAMRSIPTTTWTNGSRAGRAGLPFAVFRGSSGSDLAEGSIRTSAVYLYLPPAKTMANRAGDYGRTSRIIQPCVPNARRKTLLLEGIVPGAEKKQAVL